ncbi:hypothetical protein BST83_01390 [Polaribacter filamentus]|uniref:Glycoamylase-like domain-containing protein n=1 Tax=Polaribacter filamentus TaxID=53483 RepID=A0A2S7L2C9_9FLAO|nr:hypothetical protein [Polaribacter filamentus]PQB09027.1 hypothetical protein BST83_01390 [Polaribacter filamentus]
MFNAKQYILILIYFLFIQCNSNVEDEEMAAPEKFQLEALSSPSHYPGIALYTLDMAKNRISDVNSEWVLRKSSSVTISSEIKRNQFNAIHKINFENLRNDDDYFEFVLAIHGKLTNRTPIPNEYLKDLTGISFRAVSYDVPVKITIEALDINNVILKSQDFDLSTDKMNMFKMDISDQSLHHLSLKIQKNKQNEVSLRTGSIALDDIYLNNISNITFSPPTNDTQLLQWLKESSIKYFLWNYKAIGVNQGVVLEASDDATKVSVSGIGYAYAMYILAESEGMINPQEAKDRIEAMLNWQKAQNWFNGSQGKFGFPFHYYNSDGSGLYSNSPEAASTIDWAICAAGLRTVKQKYSSDPTIASICDELLNRPEWGKMIHNQANDTYKYGRITKGISGITGEKNGQVWGDAFTEESEIIYLEALASGKVNNLDLDRIFREKKNGFYVSWFGSGFTYNWSQLWTGAIEPYKTNSVNAYQADALSCLSSFGKPFMGLTACSTISNSDSNGFLNWNAYLGNQGANVSGANKSEVIQVSPAPYGATLALPFASDRAITALKEFVKVGYYHPLLGLPDNIRLKNYPTNIDVPVPNWSTFDINIGPMGMAIDMYQDKIISNLYLKDSNVKNSLDKLIQSF